MLQKDGSIIINEWTQGIGQSSYVGFESMLGVDVEDEPGILQIGRKLTKESGTTITDEPEAMVAYGGILYVIDEGSDGFYVRASNGSWTKSSTTGFTGFTNLLYWKDYILIASGTNSFDTYGPLSGSPALDDYNNNTSAGTYRAMIHASDDKVYVGHTNYLASFAEKAGQTFDPSSAATYTYTQAALDLPTGYEVFKIIEIGGKLLIAANHASLGKYDIFVWDMVSTSYESVISMGSEQIHTMITVGNLAYIIAGPFATIYACDGTNVKAITRLPNSVLGQAVGYSVVIAPNAVAYLRNKIYFATSDASLSTQSAIWSFSPTTGRLLMEHMISTGAIISAIINTIYVFGNKLWVGWQSGAAQGVDYEDTYRYTSYGAYLISPYYQSGQHLLRKTYQTAEIYLSATLSTGHGVKLEYRTAQGGSWTEIGTMTAGQSGYYSFAPTVAVGIQFKISMTTPASANTIGETSPKLLKVIVK